MPDTYSVIIKYHSGKRKGQTMTIDGIDNDDIMLTLGEITQDQLANSEIFVKFSDVTIDYENFLIDYFGRTSSQKN